MRTEVSVDQIAPSECTEFQRKCRDCRPECRPACLSRHRSGRQRSASDTTDEPAQRRCRQPRSRRGHIFCKSGLNMRGNSCRSCPKLSRLISSLTSHQEIMRSTVITQVYRCSLAGFPCFLRRPDRQTTDQTSHITGLSTSLRILTESVLNG